MLTYAARRRSLKLPAAKSTFPLVNVWDGTMSAFGPRTLVEWHHLYPNAGGVSLSRSGHRSFSRPVIGWSLQGGQTAGVFLQALLMALWCRKPKGTVLVHLDQKTRLASSADHALVPSCGIALNLARTLTAMWVNVFDRRKTINSDKPKWPLKRRGQIVGEGLTERTLKEKPPDL